MQDFLPQKKHHAKKRGVNFRHILCPISPVSPEFRMLPAYVAKHILTNPGHRVSQSYIAVSIPVLFQREELMTEVTGFQQSVRLFQSCDPITPSILSSFLLHLSDALPSGRVLLRLSVSTLALTVLLRCRL